MNTTTQTPAVATYQTLLSNIEKVIKGQSLPIRKLLAAFISGGHVLLEDYPGTGKTTLAKALALSIDTQFKRIQFTPDLLPSDILGVSIFNPKDQVFHFHQGPIFTQILLADEINRASPRTQSALLEAMAEGQASIDGVSRPLDPLFFVIATQNPIELRGTYPLPEAQMDRFSMQFRLGYVSLEEETAILSDQSKNHPLTDLKPCVNNDEIHALRKSAQEVRISDEIKEYIVKIVATTRSAAGVQLGASPRASITMMKISQTLALFDGLEYVTPDHIQEIAESVIAHRLTLDPQARFSGLTGGKVVQEILNKIPSPA